MAMSILAQELILGSLQAIRLHQEFAARAAEGTMSDEQLSEAWRSLESGKQAVRDKIAAKKAELQAQGG
jgi:hypothetical protein